MRMRAVMNGLRARDGHDASGMAAAFVTGRESPARVLHDLMHGMLELRFLDEREVRVLREILQIAVPILAMPLRNIPANDVDMLGIECVLWHATKSLSRCVSKLYEFNRESTIRECRYVTGM